MAGGGCRQGSADPRRILGSPGCRSVSRHGSVPHCHPAGPQGATYRLRQPRQRVPHGPSSPHPHSDRPPPRSHRRPRSRPRPPGAPPAAGCPCQRPPATGTETRPLLRTLLHREGCGGRPGKPTSRSGQQSRGRASAARARVLRLPRAGEPQPGTRPGRRCEPSHGWEPRGGESLAVTSGDKAPYGDGEVWQRLGLDEGVSSCTRSEGFCISGCSHLPGLYIQRWCGSGGAAAGGSEALAVPTLGMERAAACGPGSTGKHAVLGLRCRAGGGGERARVTLPCLENINLHVKVRAGPIPATGLPGHGDRITKLYKMGAGRVLGPGAASAGRHGARWGGRWQVRSPGDVEICLKTWRLFFVFFFP